MNNDNVIEMLSQVGALVLNSHVVYTSGRHGSAYVNKDALYVHPEVTSRVCRLMAEAYVADEVDVVAGPTVGGVVLSQWLAYHLTARRTGGETLAVYAEEEGEEKKRIFKRGYDLLLPRKNVVVVEDVVTTGGSARKVIEAVRALGGNVIGLSILCNRGGVSSEALGGVVVHSLSDVQLESWDESECRLCKEGVPVNTAVGKGKAFLGRGDAKARA
ncbi:MAG TPA: phosphoribosyltransferase family protein [Candidatus Obscuribacterales bacterium]